MVHQGSSLELVLSEWTGLDTGSDPDIPIPLFLRLAGHTLSWQYILATGHRHIGKIADCKPVERNDWRSAVDDLGTFSGDHSLHTRGQS